jgi:hypothetical protein
MKTLFIVISNDNITEANKHLNTLEGIFILPNVFKMLICGDDLDIAKNAIDYILMGITYKTIVKETEQISLS